jgi:hypothetical protein
MRIRGWTLLILGTQAALAARADPPPTFERDVRPILKAYCLDCHGGGEQLKGKLDLRLKRFAVRGGATGPALVPGRPDESELLARVRDGEMPPGEKKVPADRIAVLETWIAAGAPTAREEPESLPVGIDITSEDRAFWAFRPLGRPDPPPAGPGSRVRTPIDTFVLARLRERGLGFAPDADRRILIRRVHADLTGLPPTPEEVEAFVADPMSDAYERLVDRLLANPHYGERWARHWLDAAGYADSEGDGPQDTVRPFAYKYRDYIIRALNADKPFDQFLIEQFAGDELVPKPWANLTPEQTQVLAATGFLRTAPDGTATGAADDLVSNQVVADTIKIVSSAVLGLTVACAQCHDHRYDPVPQSDYYRLRAVFEPALDPRHWRRPGQRLISLYSDADRARAAAIEAEAQAIQRDLDSKTARFVAAATEKELAKFPEDVRCKLRAALDTPAEKRADEQKSLLASKPSVNINAGVLYQYDSKAADELKKDAERVSAKRAEKPPEDFVSVLDEVPGVAPETHVFHRGDHRQPKSPVGPGDLTIAAPDGQRCEISLDDPALPTTGRRLAYARHLVDGRHPLVGRVLMNRIWLHHFGRGIVETPGDFGALGTRPTHPELLDWLAHELVRGGWSLKRMHRLILTSTTYRQSSRRDAAQDAVDAENALFGRYAVRRLDAEALRDKVLAVSGRLDRIPFGPPVPVVEDSVGQVLPDKDSPRRSVYLQARRTKPVSLLAAFDAPAMAVNCDRRILSTSAPQALVLMNSEFTLSHAKSMAQRLRAAASAKGATDLAGPCADRLQRIIAHAWALAYQRPVSREELDAAIAFVAAPRGGDDPELAALTDLCQQLLCSNEFLYVD